MSLRIYQIPFALRACFDEAYVDDDGVFHFDEATFNEVEANAEAKIANCGRYIREQENTIEAMKAAANEIWERAKAEEKKLERLKEMTIAAVEAIGHPVNDVDIRVRTSSSVSVEITDKAALPDIWYRTTTKRAPDKVALMHALKNNELIEGARLVTNLSLQIK